MEPANQRSTEKRHRTTDSLTKAVEEFGQEAFEAANKGDAGATETVKLIRGTGRGSTVGR
jgi:hypothetical protein